MKRLSSFVLLVFLLALLAAPVGAEALPFPDLRFDYRNPKIPDDILRYSVDPVFVRGQNHLHRMSHAVFHAPSAIWANNRFVMEEEGWTVEEFNDEWNRFLDWWRRYFEISVSLYSNDIYRVSAGPVGVGEFSNAIDKFVLITSDGYREEKIMPGRSPVRLRNGPTEFRNIFTFSFRQEALDSRPEWIRLYMVSRDTQYYFEWKFDI